MSQTETQSRRPGGVMRIPRTRGALSGFLLILLGAWGALIPFIGPYFKFGFTLDAWQWTQGRLWLEVLPGVATALGGVILLTTAHRAGAVFGGWLAAAAGAWFAVGPVVSTLWGGAAADVGAPLGGTRRQVAEQFGFFYGLGVVIVFLGAHAAGRVTVRSVRDVELARREAEEAVVVEERVPEHDEPVRAEREPVPDPAGGRSGATAATEVQQRPRGTGAHEQR